MSIAFQSRKYTHVLLAGFLLLTSVSGPTQAAAAPASVVRCWGSIDKPHKSSHFKGTINAQSKIKCTENMTSISGDVVLRRDDGVVASSKIVTVRGKKLWKANAAIKCDGKKHTYTATVSVAWTAPRGMKPPMGSQKFTKRATEKC